MRVEDLIVEVRDRNLVRRGQIDPQYLVGCLFGPRANGVGAWSLRLPAVSEGEAYLPTEVLRQEAAGIIVTLPDDTVFMSGSVDYRECDRDADDPDGWWTFTGDPDDGLLADPMVYPDPSNPDPVTQGRIGDPRTGPVEDLLYAYVDANGPGAPAARIAGTFWEDVTLGVNLHRGPARSPAAENFPNLLELCQSLTPGTDLLFRMVQQGTGFVFGVTQSADLTVDVRLDVDNGQLQSVQQGSGAPTVTQAIYAGDGEGVNRTIVAATDNDAAALWRRRKERFYTGTGDVTELQVQAIQTVQQAAQDSFQVVPAEDLDVVSPAALLGATITVVMGEEELPARVNQVVLSVTEDGVYVAVALGDDDGTDWEGQVNRSLDSLTSRVSALERTTGGTDTEWVSLAPGVGITLIGGQVRRKNGVLLFRGRATKTDGSTFAAGSSAIVATLPAGLTTLLGAYDTTVLTAGQSSGTAGSAVAKMYINSGYQIYAQVMTLAMNYVTFAALNGVSVD